MQASRRVKASSPGLTRWVRNVHRRNRFVIPGVFIIGAFVAILLLWSYQSWERQQTSWEQVATWSHDNPDSSFQLWSPRLLEDLDIHNANARIKYTSTQTG